jgi:pimeloyl-ACP methyl ester carboxylesterase
MSALQSPIILVHGLIGNLADPVIIGAFGNAEVHAPDLIGYGTHQEAKTRNITLRDQADHLAAYIRRLGNRRVHVVGHSVGGAVAAILCAQCPELVASFTSIEGNFTLGDAFWSSQIAKKTEAEVAAILDGYKADPGGWIAAAGVPVNSWTCALAGRWLANQPASTVLAQAKAVVTATGHESYLADFRRTASTIPLYLIAGARSAGTWNVPSWANELCSMRINLAGCGHLMMAERPDLFANSILTCLDRRNMPPHIRNCMV